MKNKMINRPVFTYIMFFLFMLIYSYFFIAITKEFNKESLNTLKFDDIYLTLYFYIQLFLFQGITMYVMSSFSRLDGYFHLSGKDAFIISRKKFMKNNTRLIKLLIVLFFPFSLAFISNEDIKGIPLIVLLVINSFLLFFMIKYKFDKFFKNHKTFFKNMFYIILIISVFMLMWIVVSKVSLLLQQIVVAFFLIVYCIVVIYSFIIDLFNKESKTKKFFLNLLLNEYLVANQSKKNAENIALVEYLINHSSKKLSYYPSDFLRKIKGPNDWIFLKKDVEDSIIGESAFLELKKYKDFNEFIDRARKRFNADYKETLDQLEIDYLLNVHNMNALLMETRTINIKNRNWNNLILALFIFIIACILAVLFKLHFVYFALLYILMWTVFLRMMLRTLEIGRAFYKDIIDSGYSKSFLSGPDRIILAIKSVTEIACLAASIYLIQLTQDECWELSLNNIFKTVEYSFSVLLFNVSFPEGFSEDTTKSLLWLSTHLIQVISSVLLITISIAGYIGRKHFPVYFEYEFKETGLHVFKKIYKSPSKYKNLFTIQKFKSKNKIDMKRAIESKLKCLYKNGEISEEDFDQINKEINEWV